MEGKKATDIAGDHAWTWRRTGGGRVGHAIAWLTAPSSSSSEPQSLAVTRGRTLHLLSFHPTSSDLQSHGLLRGHSQDVTAVSVSVENRRCVTGSMDGTWRVWDTSDGALLKVWDTAAPVRTSSIAVLGPHEQDTGAMWVCEIRHSLRDVVAREALSGAVEHLMNLPAPAQSGHEEQPSGVVTSANAVLAYTSRTLLVRQWRGDQRVVLQLRHPLTITAVAIHPTNGSVAVGDTRGVITLYRALAPSSSLGTSTSWPHPWTDADGAPSTAMDVDAKPRDVLVDVRAADVPHATFHWHANAVTALAFAPDGVTLLSGGEESVLVAWHLASGGRRFLPRLAQGAPIVCIAPNHAGTVYAVSTADNGVRLVSALTWGVVAHLRGVRPVLPDSYPTTIVPEPTTPGCMLLGGLPVAIQVYDVLRDEHVMDLTVSERNVVSRGVAARPVPPRVDVLAVSPDGRTLATVDRRKRFDKTKDSKDHYSAECLRFWVRDETARTFVVNTRVDEPHRGGSVTQIAFHPTRPFAVTTSTIGTFRLWGEFEDDRGLTSWECLRTGEYRGLRCSSCAFSTDGSILAVSCGSVITLWSIDGAGSNLNLIQALSHPPPSEPILSVGFPGGDSSLVVSVTPRSIYVWSVMSMSVWWSCTMDVTGLAVDPLCSRFAVSAILPPPDAARQVSKESSTDRKRGTSAKLLSAVIVFDCDSPVPVHCHRLTDDSKMRAIAFLDLGTRRGDGADSCAAWLDSQMEFHLLVPRGVELQLTDADALPTDLATAMKDEEDVEEARRPTKSVVASVVTDRRSAYGAFDCLVGQDAHTLPDASKLLSSLTEALLSTEDIADHADIMDVTPVVDEEGSSSDDDNPLPQANSVPGQDSTEPRPVTPSVPPIAQRYRDNGPPTAGPILQFVDFFEGLNAPPPPPPRGPLPVPVLPPRPRPAVVEDNSTVPRSSTHLRSRRASVAVADNDSGTTGSQLRRSGRLRRSMNPEDALERRGVQEDGSETTSQLRRSGRVRRSVLPEDSSDRRAVREEDSETTAQLRRSGRVRRSMAPEDSSDRREVREEESETTSQVRRSARLLSGSGKPK